MKNREAPYTGPKPCVILVDPTGDGNIGATARAMANFGLTDLRLVRPLDGWHSYFCRQMASGANHVLDAVKVFETTQAAVQDLQKVYATSARRRDMIKPILSAQQAGIDMAQLSQVGVATGFLFGTERSGLANDDITMSDAVVSINLSPDHASLNLAQAVLLLAYEWYQAISVPRAQKHLYKGRTVFAKKVEVEGFFGHLERELDAANFWRVADKKPDMFTNVKNIFLRCDLTHQEVQTLRGIIQALVYHRWPNLIDPGTKKPRRP